MKQRPKYIRSRKPLHGFTLIELLVVISIIALLLAILMPSLQMARYQAKRVYCLSNIKSQYLAQIMYAENNDGKFAPHDDMFPNVVRTNVPAYLEYLHKVMYPYIKNSQILICPLLVKMGKNFATTDWEAWNGTYGGWDYVNPNTHGPAGIIANVYSWFANYRNASGTEPRFRFNSYEGYAVDEPAWPKNVTQCTNERAFISHSAGVYSNMLDDFSHGGRGAVSIDSYDDVPKLMESRDSPVGYADGHIEIIVRSLKARARVENANYDIYY